MTDTDDRIRIFVHDCRVPLNVGLYESEIGHPQPVLINVECEAHLSRRYDDIADKELSHVINYQPLYEFITTELVQMGHIYLLESVADTIASFCFRDARIIKARIRLEKTSIFPGAAGGGIEIVRTRV
jgi:dihydroneopterin aldolase